MASTSISATSAGSGGSGAAVLAAEQVAQDDRPGPQFLVAEDQRPTSPVPVGGLEMGREFAALPVGEGRLGRPGSQGADDRTSRARAASPSAIAWMPARGRPWSPATPAR